VSPLLYTYRQYFPLGTLVEIPVVLFILECVYSVFPNLDRGLPNNALDGSRMVDGCLTQLNNYTCHKYNTYIGYNIFFNIIKTQNVQRYAY